MNVDPDTEEMSETERKRAVERAGIPDPAEADDGSGDATDGDQGEEDVDAVVEVG